MRGYFLTGELDELGERLQSEFGVDRDALSPAIAEKLFQLQLAEEKLSRTATTSVKD